MISKELKYYIFSIDEDKREMGIYDKETGKEIWLNKTYAFSLMRFLIRFCYRLTIKKRKNNP